MLAAPEVGRDAAESWRLACGPRVAAVVCVLLGESAVDDEFEPLVDSSGGTSFRSLGMWFASHGIYSVPIRTNPAYLRTHQGIYVLQLDKPWDTDLTRGTQSHLVVAICGGAGNDPILVDASRSLLEQEAMTFRRILRSWTGAALVVSSSPPSLMDSSMLWWTLGGTLAGVATAKVRCWRKLRTTSQCIAVP